MQINTAASFYKLNLKFLVLHLEWNLAIFKIFKFSIKNCKNKFGDKENLLISAQIHSHQAKEHQRERKQE